MSGNDLIAINALTKQFVEADANCRAAAKKTVELALVAGEAAMKLRDATGHGEFAEVIAEQTDVSMRTVQRYMRLHRNRKRLTGEDGKLLVDSFRGAERLLLEEDSIDREIRHGVSHLDAEEHEEDVFPVDGMMRYGHYPEGILLVEASGDYLRMARTVELRAVDDGELLDCEVQWTKRGIHRDHAEVTLAEWTIDLNSIEWSDPQPRSAECNLLLEFINDSADYWSQWRYPEATELAADLAEVA